MHGQTHTHNDTRTQTHNKEGIMSHRFVSRERTDGRQQTKKRKEDEARRERESESGKGGERKREREWEHCITYQNQAGKKKNSKLCWGFSWIIYSDSNICTQTHSHLPSPSSVAPLVTVDRPAFTEKASKHLIKAAESEQPAIVPDI